MWKALIDVLGKLDLAYRDLLSLGERKRGLLVSVDMKGLEAALKEEELLAHRVQELERGRKGILEKLAAGEKGIRPDMRLPELFSLAPSRPVEDRLRSLHDGLDRHVRQLAELNGNNMILTRAALDAVTARLNRMGGATVEPAYSASGQDVVSRTKNFDFKA